MFPSSCSVVVQPNLGVAVGSHGTSVFDVLRKAPQRWDEGFVCREESMLVQEQSVAVAHRDKAFLLRISAYRRALSGGTFCHFRQLGGWCWTRPVLRMEMADANFAARGGPTASSSLIQLLPDFSVLYPFRALYCCHFYISCVLAQTCFFVANRWQEALELLSSTRATGLVPDVVSYTSAMSACDRAGEWQVSFATQYDRMSVSCALTYLKRWLLRYVVQSLIYTITGSRASGVDCSDTIIVRLCVVKGDCLAR